MSGELELTAADKLVEGWIPFFWSADREIQWKAVEVEHQLWLDDHTLLMGKTDAIGINGAGCDFFGDWKTSKPEWKTKQGYWKRYWLNNPQAMTYGVLFADMIKPDAEGYRHFTVRKAFKSNPPTYDFEWFKYNQAEIDFWKRELLEMSAEIRLYRQWRAHKALNQGENWPVNFNHCFKYGEQYACPFYHEGCAKLDFTTIPEGVKPREFHLKAEKEFQLGQDLPVSDRLVVVLDATRVETYIGCHERYRREYEWGGIGYRNPTNEAAETGHEFHDMLENYYRGLING